MSNIPPFSGFPQAGQQFLQDLAANNNRDWFEANKETYLNSLRDSALSFVVTMGERLQELSDGIRYDTRTNGGGSMMRINRDIRFSKDKTPYKTNVSMLFWNGAGKKTEHPAFGIQITAEGAGLMSGMHSFPKPTLEAYRQAVDDATAGLELETAMKVVRDAGEYEVGGEHYKKVPRGYAADHPRANLLRYAALYAHFIDLEWSQLTSPDFVEICFEHFRKMAPIQQWLVKHT